MSGTVATTDDDRGDSVTDYINDPERLRALEDSGMLTDEIEGVDRLIRVTKKVLDCPVVFLTAVAPDRQVFVAQDGLPEQWVEDGSTPLSYSFCRLVVAERAALVIPDASKDPRVSDNFAIPDAHIGAYVGVPVRTGDGHILGSFCAVDHEPREWSDHDVSLLVDLAAAVEAHVRLHATQVQLQDQLAAATLDRAVEKAMMELAAATSRSSTTPDIIQAVIEHGQAAVGSITMSIGITESAVIRLTHSEGVSAEVADAWPSASIDAPVPMAEAVRTGRRIVLMSPKEFEPWPLFRDAALRLGIRSFAAIPIRSALAGTDAVLGIGWPEPLRRRRLPAVVERLATITGQGLDQAENFARAKEHASMLESIVLPAELPIVPGIESSGMYLPPTSGQRVGGDVYDVVVRDDNQIGLLVADAAGHTISSSKAITRVRHAMGALTLEECAPSDVLRSVNAYLSRSFMQSYVTACYALLDVEAGLLTIANAGHPQPCLLTAHGEVVRVGPLGEQLLGVSDFDYSEHAVPFEPGDSLVMFTDGLIERRGAPIEIGEMWLEELLGGNNELVPSDLTQRIQQEITDEREDDVAVLVVRRTSEDLAVWTELYRAEQTTGSLALAQVRAEIRRVLEPLITARSSDVELVATELLSNAVEATGDLDAPVTIVMLRRDEDLEIVVENVGDAFIAVPSMPPAKSARGRGLAIASTLSDLKVDSLDGKVRIHARFGGVLDG